MPKSKLAVNLIILAVFAVSLLTLVTNKNYWPFVTYDMFANLKDLTEPSYELEGTFANHKVVAIPLGDFSPYHWTEVNKMIRRETSVDEQRLSARLSVLRDLYNHRRNESNADRLVSLTAYRRPNRESQDKIKLGTSK